MSRLAAALLALAAFAAGGILFHNPPARSLPILTDDDRAILAEIAVEPSEREAVCDRIIDSVADLLAQESFDEQAARRD